MSSVNLKYYSQLDGIRCFAIISVMIGHWISWDSTNPILKNAPWGHGVILFFVLSGYLISNILFEQKEKIDSGEISIRESFKTFYIRRFLRIFPLYYLLIIYLYYINYSNTRELFPWLVTYTSNIKQNISGNYVGDFNHFWSLAVEEQFYILWPLLVFYLPKDRIRNVMIILVTISFLSRLTCYLISPGNWMLAAYFTPNLFLPLILGAFISYTKRYQIKTFHLLTNSILLYSIAIIYVLCYYVFHFKLHFNPFDMIFDEYLFSIMCVFIVAKAATNSFSHLSKFILEHELVVFTGKISYGLYIFHLFVIGFFWNYLAMEFKLGIENKHAMWFTYFITTYILAILSYYILEKPFNNLKKYFSY